MHVQLVEFCRHAANYFSSADSSDHLMYMHGCCLTKRYVECIQAYDRFVKVSPDLKELMNAKYIKVKALYYIYTMEQMQLHADAGAMSPKDFTIRHKKCYDKVKELIVLLGDIIDRNVEGDADIFKLLDSAMIDYIHETNRLQEIKRCYLCYKNLHDEASAELHASVMEQLSQLLSSGSEHLPVNDNKHELDNSLSTSARSERNSSTVLCTEGDAESSAPPLKKTKLSSGPAKKDSKLIRSHLFPDAILNRFAHAVPLPNNAKVVISHMPGLGHQRKFQNRLISPHKSALFMLCSTCELTLSQYGETQFLPQFFEKLYDIKSPFQSAEEQVIQYSEHLYSFCLGLIFRTLYWNPGKYTNEEDLQQLRQHCRQYLLTLQSRVIPNLDNLPNVFILISPFSAPVDELECGFLNSTLSGSCFAILANNSLSTGDVSIETIIKPQYFLVHMGAINIVVKLTPSNEISSEYLISPQGGNYHVPVESERRSLLPNGIWGSFQMIAQNIERKWLEGSQTHLDFSTDEKSIHQPTASTAEAFRIMKGRDAEIRHIALSGIQPSSDPNIPKVISFLPDQFYVRPFQRPTIELPKGHKLLIHETSGDSVSGNTVFIAVGTEHHGRYTVEKPYIIWHYYNLGIQITFAFFVLMNGHDFEAGEYLADSGQKLQIRNFNEVTQIRSNLSNLLPGILQAKGFFSFQSLMNRVKSLRSNFSVVDLKCSIVNDSQCWFCEDLCDFCLQKPVGAATSRASFISDKTVTLILCSDTCDTLMKKTPSRQLYALSSDRRVYCDDGSELSAEELHTRFGSHCAPVLPSHEEILQLYSITTTTDSDNSFSLEETSLCYGDFISPKDLYVVYYRRTFQGSPLCLEFFVTPELAPTCLLPHYNTSKDSAATVAFHEFEIEGSRLQLQLATGINISNTNLYK